MSFFVDINKQSIECASLSTVRGVGYDHDSLSVRSQIYKLTLKSSTWVSVRNSVVDPGFPARGRKPLLWENLLFAKILASKLHKNEIGPRGDASLVPSVDPPMELHCVYEWWSQDFPDGRGTPMPTPEVGHQHIILVIFP